MLYDLRNDPEEVRDIAKESPLTNDLMQILQATRDATVWQLLGRHTAQHILS